MVVQAHAFTGIRAISASSVRCVYVRDICMCVYIHTYIYGGTGACIYRDMCDQC